MKKKSEFEAPYIGIETIDNTPIFYNRRGDYSVIIAENGAYPPTQNA